MFILTSDWRRDFLILFFFFAQRLVEQIKQWEVGFLGHLGVDEETSKMQNRLGIKVVPDQTPSTESLTTSWKVIQEDPELPKWSARDAVKVCSYYCIYRLLDACAFAEGMPASAPTRPRRKLRVKITTKQSEVCITTNLKTMRK